MDFKKIGKFADPLLVFPELDDLPSWGATLVAHLEYLRNQLEPLPEPPDDLEGNELREWLEVAKANQGPLYEHIPQADEVRRYMLYCYAKTSPHGGVSDMEKRRQKSLDSAGIDKRERTLDGWRFFVGLDLYAARMLAQLLRETKDRIYNRWLSDVMAFENLCEELRSPAVMMEEDKKTAAYERKLKISAALPEMEKRIAESAAILFGSDAQAVDAVTGVALGEKSDFQGGMMEKYAKNVG